MLEPLPVCDAPVVTTQTWETASFVPSPEAARAPTGLALADLDGDDTYELVYAAMAGSVVLRTVGGELALASEFTMDGGPFPAALTVAAADPDRDGDQDLFLGTWKGEPDLMLWNDGAGHFTREELPESDGLATVAVFVDLDGDGALDLFVGRGHEREGSAEDVVAERLEGDPSSLYLWNEGWVDRSDWIPAEVGPAHTLGIGPLDADLDGDIDLWLANDFGPYIVEDLLLRNEGDHFVIADPGAHLAHYGMGVAVGDANQDGLVDLYVTDIGGPDLLVGQGDGTFVDATFASGAGLGHEPDRLTSWATRFVDMDGDLYEDIVVAFGRLDEQSQEWVTTIDPDYSAADDQRDALLLSDGAGGFRDVGDAVGFDDPARVRPMTIGDLDGDRIPEVIVAGKNDLVLYRTAGGCPSRASLWVEGDDATPAEGARVVLDVAGHKATSWVVGTATGSSVPPELFLGLNHEASAEVTVTWPDGRTTTATVAAGERRVVSPPSD